MSLTGVSGTGNVGSMSLSTATGSTFDATNVTLDTTGKTFDEA
mgnify:FL=1